MGRNEYIVNNIKTTLENVDEIAEVIPRPLGENETIDNYPTAIFYPVSSENSFETVSQNKKTYRYELVLLIGLKNDTAESVFLTAMPELIDAVEAEIDKDWDAGTLDGSRVYKWIDNGVSGVDTGTNEAYQRLIINVRVLVNN